MNQAKKIRIIFSVVGISFIQGLQYCISPVLQQIKEYYPSVDVSLIQMLVTAPALIAMVVALISGWLVIKISKKRLLLFGSIIAGAAGFLPFLTDQFWVLFTSRVLYGIGLGLATALNLSVVAEFFSGEERVRAMGIQAASVGAGMVVATTAGGVFGQSSFQNACLIHIIGLLSAVVIAVCLPDTGVVKVSKTEKIKINKSVILYAGFGMIEFMFLITFTTNIAMHLSGRLTGNAAVSGNLTGVFSGAQIVIGFLLGYVTKMTKQYTLPAAMISFCIGALFLIFFPSNVVMLTGGAVFCGFSQGVFIPQALVEVSNAVSAASMTMASACFTCGMCLGQLLSPIVLNSCSKLVFGETTTANVFAAAAAGMAVAAVIFIGIVRKQIQEERI